MDTGSKRTLHPLLAAASVAVIALAAVGIAAFTGLLPSSHGSTASPQSAAATQAADRTYAGALRGVTDRAALEEHAGRAESFVAQRAQPARSRPQCPDCGVVESVRAAEVKGRGTGLGAVAGGLAGALLGNQIGNGGGRTVMTLVGAAGGALAGNQIEKNVRATKHWIVRVRLSDGHTRAISYKTEPAWRAGDRVRIVHGVIEPLA